MIKPISVLSREINKSITCLKNIDILRCPNEVEVFNEVNVKLQMFYMEMFFDYSVVNMQSIIWFLHNMIASDLSFLKLKSVFLSHSVKLSPI